MRPFVRNLRETFSTAGELILFFIRRGQWWLMPVVLLALLLGLGLAAGQLGLLSFIYVIF
jgi:hypothetical protein